ncbi:MAG: 1-acyl-sn-glycerol-3-phosphate acyltransferase [Clostridia bacterium]|nr:lysophospholipid acyltransferase family protein [Lachnospiraceae bacterium]NCC00472.1 1-acyl-sn-glycerol-3-phosphate acyltransferase [Clostridia bacterium]NCD02483.1 1-acyl-sn-glycerol-3-phosphate acyltransferase [Clostridia bacterium]
MIRIISIVLFLVLFSIVSLPVYLVMNIIGHFNPYRKAQLSQSFVVGAFKIILKISGTTIHVTGLENVPEDTPVLYVGNHRSYYDIVTCYTLVKNNTGFISKKEMEKIPCISRWMRYLNCQFLDRENVREGLKTILSCIDLVKNGTSIFLFPEGTRNLGGEMLPFKEGGFKIALKTGCPIVPVAIYNTENIFETHLPRVKKQTVSIQFGAPIYVENLSPAEKKSLGTSVQAQIVDMLNEK